MFKNLLALLVVILHASICFAQQYGSFKDPRDGKVYKTVKIGEQEWMAENLDVSAFRNGDLITEAKTDEEWNTAGIKGFPVWCHYDNILTNGKKYGKLYNWHAVNDPRGLAPEGWHIPTDAEWSVLTEYLGGESKSGTKLKSSMGWKSVEGKNGNGNNESGFNALPAGRRYKLYDNFHFVSGNAYWWTSSAEEAYAWYFYLFYGNETCRKNLFPKDHGMSVRCVRD